MNKKIDTQVLHVLTKEYIFENSVNAEDYLNKVDENYLPRWEKKLDQVKFTEEQLKFLNDNLPEVNIVVFSADWCGDCQNGVPVLMKIAEANSQINLRLIDRDSHQEMLEKYLTSGSKKIPLVFFMNSEYQEINRWVERSAYSYSMWYEAKKQAIANDSDNYSGYLRPLLKEHSSQMFTENTREIMDCLVKAVALIRATMSLEKLKPLVS